MKNNKNSKVKRFFSPLEWNMWFLIKPSIVSLIISLFWIATVELTKYATNCIQNQYLHWMIICVIAYSIVVITHWLFRFLTRHEWWSKMWYEWKKYIQSKILPVFFNLDNTALEKIWTWRMQYIMDKWITTRNYIFFELQNTVPPLIITSIYAFIQIYKAAWLYSIIFLVLLVWTVFLVKYFNEKAITYRKKRVEKEWEYSRQFIKMIMSKMEIVWNSKEQHEIRKTDKILTETTIINKKVWTYALFMRLSSKILCEMLNIFVIWYWVIILKSWWDLSLFVWLLACVSLLNGKVNDFTSFYKNLTDQFSNVQILRETFDNMPKMENKKSDAPFNYKKWDIEIKKISFSYWEWKNVFENFSLKIKWSTKTAFVWESWTWKTTLLKLIAWYIVPNNWEIFVDRQEIHNVNINDYFWNIGFLTQDPSVFDGTIYENLIYALKWKPSDVLLKKIIKAAKCEFIYDFAEWLQTEIWERGVRLSWWQKQRLAIAKIMLKNPNIILLDEPTSALDSFNEEEISQALNNLFKWKTVIIVAHRLQTVKSADRILLFENGKVVEDWTHQYLIKKNGKYKRMLDLQTGF